MLHSTLRPKPPKQEKGLPVKVGIISQRFIRTLFPFCLLFFCFCGFFLRKEEEKKNQLRKIPQRVTIVLGVSFKGLAPGPLPPPGQGGGRVCGSYMREDGLASS